MKPFVSGLFIDVRCTAGGYSTVARRGELYCKKESSIAKRRALLQKGELYCKKESSIAKRRALLQRGKLYCGALYSRKHLAYCASTISGFNATSMKTRKLSFHHHDTTLHDCSVLPKIEELLISIGFGRG